MFSTRLVDLTVGGFVMLVLAFQLFKVLVTAILATILTLLK
jgi:hypothetical protein